VNVFVSLQDSGGSWFDAFVACREDSEDGVPAGNTSKDCMGRAADAQACSTTSSRILPRLPCWPRSVNRSLTGRRQDARMKPLFPASEEGLLLAAVEVLPPDPL